MIKVRQKGSFRKTKDFLSKNSKPLSRTYKHILEKYAEEGVRALKSATPRDTGLTAESWYYKITESKNNVYLTFLNSNTDTGVPVAIMIRYGHTMPNGGWVAGQDYITPALKPIFDKLLNNVWEEVKRS